MDLAVTILIGVGAGAMVELLLPGHHLSELLLAMLLGIAGALLARYVGEKAGWFGTEDPASFIASGFGSIIFLVLYGLISRRGHRRGRR
jgi:uncharacterized membrane protein YeaQ/YmgE (transglycosylase-associated protein family)